MGNDPNSLRCFSDKTELDSYQAHSTSNGQNTSSDFGGDLILAVGQPPAYSNGDSNSQPESGSLQPVTSVQFDLRQYQIPHFTISEDQTTVTTTSPLYTSNPGALIELLQHQAALPPKPLVRIKGTHSEYGASYGPIRTDFDLTMNLMPLIVRAGTDKWNYLRILSPGENCFRVGGMLASEKEDMGLDEWARRFCDDQAASKRYGFWDSSIPPLIFLCSLCSYSLCFLISHP
jgi:hypothetical protein